MATLGQVMVEVGADLKSFEKSMADVEKKMRETGRGLGKTGDSMSDSITNSFDEVGDSFRDTEEQMKRFQKQFRRTREVSSKNLKNLPEHLKPFAKEMYETEKQLKNMSLNGANDLDTLRDSVMKTRVGFDKMTSVTSSGKKVTKMLQEMKKDTDKARMAVLGFNKDATMKISTEDTQRELKSFQKNLDSTKKKLEDMRDAGDIGSYTAGMAELAYQTKLVDKAMQGVARGGNSYMGVLASMGIMTEAIGNQSAIAMEKMKEGFLRSNDMMQAMATPADKLRKNLDRMNVRKLDQQIVKVADKLQTMAKRGAVANVAIKELGEGASMKDLQDQIKLINQGLMRTQMLQMGMGIGVIAFTVGMIKLSNAVDGRLIPAAAKFKKTWLKALTPIGKAWTDMALKVIELGTKIGELIGKFTEAHPVLAGMIGNIIYLTSVFALLLAPLAIGISAAGSFAANFAALYVLIEPFVTGLLAVIGTATLVAAALVIAAVAIGNMWKASEDFRGAATGLWESIKSAVLTAVQPMLDKWVELKDAFVDLWNNFTNGGASMQDVWQFLGDKVAAVIAIITPLISTVLSAAFQILAAIVMPIMDGLIAIVGWLGDKWEENSGRITSVLQIVWDAIVLAFSSIQSFIQEILPQILDVIESTFELIQAAIDFAMKYIWPIVEDCFNLIWDLIKIVMPIVLGIIVDTWENIKSAIKNAIDLIQGVIELFTAVLQGNWGDAWDAVKKITKAALGLLWDLVQIWVVGKILKLFKVFGGKIGSALKDVGSKMLKPFKDGYTKVMGEVKRLKSEATSAFGEMKSSIRDRLSDLKGIITKPFTSAWSAIKSIPGKISSAFSRMRIKIPKFSLPKISIGTKEAFGGKVKVPTFNVKWNAKGNILKKPTYIGGGHAGGEAGNEAVMPIGRKRLFKPWAGMVSELLADNLGGAAGTGGGVVNRFEISQLVVREEADVDKIAAALEKKQRQQTRAKGGFVFA
ncbi:phage tail protein [Peribacillus muralis]|uniref:phage tail protein n=1 Tax=Peribacillus muralis TaxID=264697 RepID=UPI003670756B